MEQLDDRAGAVDVGGQRHQVGLGVALLLARDLRLGRLLDEAGGAVRHHLRGDRDLGHRRDEVGHVVVQAVGQRREVDLGAVVAALGPQAVLDGVEAGEGRIGLGLVEVVGPGVDDAVRVREQLGDRLDLLPRDAGVGVELLGLGDVARPDGVRERFGARGQLRGLLVHVSRVGGHRRGQRGLVDLAVGSRRSLTPLTGDDQVGPWVGGGAADHLVLACRERDRVRARLAGFEELLGDDLGDRGQDLEFGAGAGRVDDRERDLAGGGIELGRVAAVVRDGDGDRRAPGGATRAGRLVAPAGRRHHQQHRRRSTEAVVNAPHVGSSSSSSSSSSSGLTARHR